MESVEPLIDATTSFCRTPFNPSPMTQAKQKSSTSTNADKPNACFAESASYPALRPSRLRSKSDPYYWISEFADGPFKQ